MLPRLSVSDRIASGASASGSSINLCAATHGAVLQTRLRVETCCTMSLRATGPVRNASGQLATKGRCLGGPNCLGPSPECLGPSSSRKRLARPRLARPGLTRPRLARPRLAPPNLDQPRVSWPRQPQPRVARPSLAQPRLARLRLPLPKLGSPGRRLLARPLPSGLHRPRQQYLPETGGRRARPSVPPDTAFHAQEDGANAEEQVVKAVAANLNRGPVFPRMERRGWQRPRARLLLRGRNMLASVGEPIAYAFSSDIIPYLCPFSASRHLCIAAPGGR